MSKIPSRVLCLLFLFQIFSFAQTDNDYISSKTPFELIPKANAVVRYEKQVVEVSAYNRMHVTTKRVVTVFNKYGERHHDAFEHYNNNIKIKDLEVRIFDASGQEIKKVKSRDFNDESAVSGGTLYSDFRVKYLDYTPVNYPYTIEFYSEVEQRSTAFVPEWNPIDSYYLSVQHSEYELINNSDVEIKAKSQNFENFNVETNGKHHVVAKNLKAIKPEEYSPNISEMTPRLKLALTQFDMEGVEGVNNTWEDFGKWMYNNLLMGTDELPQTAINDVKALTEGVEDKLERAKLVYKYMQDKTRYISVQVGIGGWKPMLANEVDRLGYADCKGLTNYTKALLEAVDVPSYYTVVYGDTDLKNIDKDFSVTEGNHVILCLPNEEENIFLECTSQTNPFGFTAGFTDDRDVLLITPEGGKIVHTKYYSEEESKQLTDALINLNENGGFTAEVKIETTGYQYGLHEGLENQNVRDQKMYYKNYWDNINSLDIGEMILENDKENIVYTEKIAVNATSYASKTGNRLILQPNMFNKISAVPPRYENRQSDFKITRGFTDIDEFIIKIPENMKVEAMNDNESIETKFGSYSYNIEPLEGNKLKYSRKYIMKKGNYEKDDYMKFREFNKKIVKADNAKIVLISI
ncbi:DUF3857 domain-containing protein [Winogradskyella ursingii]|uniref:DUF3857 domain-containing protein n=1 Tax=Winogradskyella ursingii TaxID=2686079 RepID=UPI0015CBEC71|nr:DUF3857 domain-containing protein [Winogradskyella ursingii]